MIELKWLKTVLVALLLLLFQVTVLNQVSLLGFARPFVYPLILLLLPFDSNRAGVLVLALALGLLLDSFSDSPGLHAASLVLLAWLRPHVASLLTPRAGYEAADEPRVANLGLPWFSAYAGMLLLAHHIMFFSLEIFSFAALGRIFVHVISSGILSLILLLALEYLFGPPVSRKSLSR